MKVIIIAITLLLSLSLSNQTVGVDVSDLVTQKQWECLMQPGGQGPIEFAIIRVYQSNGVVDPNAVATIQNAAAAGIPTIDGYIFPCVPCGNGGSQVTTAINHLQNNNANIGTLWLDIERYHWSDDLTSNQNFITDMITAGQNAGVNLGIYAGYYSWEAIVGLNWSYPNSLGLPLWYAHYDDLPNFSDFKSNYGGWTQATYKQYIGNAKSCGVGVDYDYSN